MVCCLLSSLVHRVHGAFMVSRSVNISALGRVQNQNFMSTTATSTSTEFRRRNLLSFQLDMAKNEEEETEEEEETNEEIEEEENNNANTNTNNNANNAKEEINIQNQEEPIVLHDLNWRVAKMRLEEANTRRFLKAGPRFLPYEECRKWVQAWSRWDCEEEWVSWINEGEKRNSYIPAMPDVYYGKRGEWLGWDHFLGVVRKEEEDFQ